jgi:excisionase family DNA binding protein
MENLLTTEEVAVRLGVTGSRVRAMIRDERLPAQKFGHVHMIKEADLQLVKDRKTGRPPNVATATKASKKRGKK